MKKFDIIDHTADVGIIAYGAELEEVFANAAYAMFTLIADLEKVGEVVCQEIEVQAEDQESLLVRWLNELLYLFDVNQIVFKKFDILELGETHLTSPGKIADFVETPGLPPNQGFGWVLKARGYGEGIDLARHDLKTGVKAATYHMLHMEKDDGYKVQVIFDI